jgi:tetratricopeptide (TPR) repeat protein
MRKWAYFLTGALCAATAGPDAWADTRAAQIGSIEQRSEGPCSPPIINNEGHVSISCQAVDGNALKYLEDKLSEQFRQLSDQLRGLNDSSRTIRNLNDLNDALRQQADDWSRRYRELSERLAQTEGNSARAKRANELIETGEFAEAETILESLSAEAEKEIDRAAATQYDLGHIAMLRFDPARALPHYDKAFRYRPDEPNYAAGYAEAAFAEGNFPEAEKGWKASLEAERTRISRDADPDLARSNIAAALNNLGISTAIPADGAKQKERTARRFRSSATSPRAIHNRTGPM